MKHKTFEYTNINRIDIESNTYVKLTTFDGVNIDINTDTNGFQHTIMGIIHHDGNVTLYVTE